MSSLPHEVLTLIFHDLKKNDLLQCQLTSKQWHEVSLKHLYCSVVIYSDEQSQAYVRTVSNSLRLGNYLNSINFTNVLMPDEDSLVFDKCGLLNTVITYCPNITEMRSIQLDYLFWTRLTYAAIQGQLLHLNTLPNCDSTHIEPYIYTALMFKNSLTSLWLSDDGSFFGPQLANLIVFKILNDQIDQFKNLQHLYIGCICDKYLSYFDELIDKCHHLKTLTLEFVIETIQHSNEPERTTIRARPDIHSFSCEWRIINAEKQLEYIMCKFSNLRSLTIEDESIPMTNENFTPYFTRHTLIKFIRYVMSIPDFKIQIDVNEEDILNIWAEFMKINKGCKDISIMYRHRHRPPNNWYNVKLCSTRGLELEFPLGTNDDEPPHIRFLSKVGGLMRSLTVCYPCYIPNINREASKTMDWLFDILQLCPLMEELTIDSITSFLPSCHLLKYSSIKKLNLSSTPNSILDHLSLNLPSLQQLKFSLSYGHDYAMIPLLINMPHTSIDLLIWEDKIYDNNLSTGIYIKLNTDAGLMYYEYNIHTLNPIDPNRYLLSPEHISLEITCRYLKALRLKKEAYLGSEFNYVF